MFNWKLFWALRLFPNDIPKCTENKYKMAFCWVVSDLKFSYVSGLQRTCRDWMAFLAIAWVLLKRQKYRGNEIHYLHYIHSRPLLENGLHRPENHYGRNGFSSVFTSAVGVDGAEFPSEDNISLLSRQCLIVIISLKYHHMFTLHQTNNSETF